MRYSDREKTVLDFMYFWRYNGIPEERILMDIAEWARDAKKGTMLEYSKSYPAVIRDIAKRC